MSTKHQNNGTESDAEIRARLIRELDEESKREMKEAREAADKLLNPRGGVFRWSTSVTSTG